MQLFEEVKRHKPSVVYIPNINIWWDTLADSVKRTFVGLLRSLPPTDPVLLLGILEHEAGNDGGESANPQMLRELFGYSVKNQYVLSRPEEGARREFFEGIIGFLRRAPSEFPAVDGPGRKKRKLAVLPVAPPRVVEGPTKAELKAQKKQDYQTLNFLKLHVQPVMDQIKRIGKKFRSGVVEERSIAYLIDERNPTVLTTDLTDEQKQAQLMVRPYEIETDEKGFEGLREVATGKFYYNLDIVTIEKRLSNGYYKRPKDFTADIKRLAKDAKTFGDADRTLKANEMLANVEVDMAALDTTQPALVAACEAVYEREQARVKQQAEAARERGEQVPRIMPNVPPPNASKTTTENSGPVVLGQEVPGHQAFPITPHRPGPNSTYWSTTNGTTNPSNQTNGSTAPHEDSEMLDNQPSVPPQPHHHQNTQSQQHQYSQLSAHTHIAPGANLEQYQNDASTTTSGGGGQKTSDRSSGPFSTTHTQSTNGGSGGGLHVVGEFQHHPDLALMGPALSGSQIPDTQEPSAASQPSNASASSQLGEVMAPPRPMLSGAATGGRASSINALLNEPVAPPPPPAPQQQILLDEGALEILHEEFVRRSSGLSLEQLEQVRAGIMGVIWGLRGEWNRNRVWVEVQGVFNRGVEDIERCQGVGDPSQEGRRGE